MPRLPVMLGVLQGLTGLTSGRAGGVPLLPGQRRVAPARHAGRAAGPEAARPSRVLCGAQYLGRQQRPRLYGVCVHPGAHAHHLPQKSCCTYVLHSRSHTWRADLATLCQVCCIRHAPCLAQRCGPCSGLPLFPRSWLSLCKHIPLAVPVTTVLTGLLCLQRD